MTAAEITRQRIQQARQLAKDEFGDENPVVVVAILQAISMSDFQDFFEAELRDLKNCIYASSQN